MSTLNIMRKEFSLVIAELRSSRTTVDQALGRIAVLPECLRQVELKLARKDEIIKRLQLLIKRTAEENRLLKNELNKSDSAKMKSEMNKLRGENKKLKAKCKAKAIALRQYELLLDDIAPDVYREDPDEEDGPPSDDSAGAEDIEMDGVTDSQVPSSNPEDSDESDPEDSDFELDEKDKAKMMKEKRRKKKLKKKLKRKLKKKLK